MADEEHLHKLQQGSEVWNRWREENPQARPDLRGAYIRGADLGGADLHWADLREADLWGTDLRNANLVRGRLLGARLHGAILATANVRGADLWRADLTKADLNGANLSEAKLRVSNLYEANLQRTDLSGADLSNANFHAADLRGANLSGAYAGNTVFADLDLREVKGLETMIHGAPSTIGIDTIYRSKGKISETFLRGAGVLDTFIAYAASLTGEAIQYYSCFISYSSKNEAFAERLHNDLQGKGVRCWFAPEDMKIGDKIRLRIDESIRVHDKLLLVLFRAFSDQSMGGVRS